MIEEGLTVEESAYEARMSNTDDIQNTALERRFNHAGNLVSATDSDFSSPKEGDWIRLRILYQDGQKSHKLEPRWEGPYV